MRFCQLGVGFIVFLSFPCPLPAMVWCLAIKEGVADPCQEVNGGDKEVLKGKGKSASEIGDSGSRVCRR